MRTIYLFSTSSHPDAFSINSLDITLFKPEVNFSHYDYLIITSKQALNALKQYDSQEYHHTKSLCISSATAKLAQKLKISLLEVGEGYGDTLVDIIQKYPKKTKWLYLRAQVIASDFAQVCRDKGYNINEQIVYKSECATILTKITPKDDSILIFTSPSAVKCFLNHHNFTKEHSIIVIGKTTAKSLPKGVSFTISPQSTIVSCIHLANTQADILN